MTNPTNSNYELAQASAYNVLASSHLSKIPLDIKSLIRSYDIKIQTYSSFAKDMKVTIEKVILLCASDDGCIMKRSDNTFLLLYNDIVKNFGRQRFTLAHEFGHFILKHHEETEETVISRRSSAIKLAPKKYIRFEQEANYFAKRLLAPIPLVDEYIEHFKIRKFIPKVLSEIFGISEEVAKYIIKELDMRSKRTTIRKETHALLRNFQEFVKNEFNTKFCNLCHATSSTVSTFCRVCGEKTFTLPSLNTFVKLHQLRKRHSMIYQKLKLDEEGRLSEQCPVCENENLHDSYCQICGKFIINKCTGIKESINGFLTTQDPCENPLEGDARYCYVCGARSTFLENEILPTWMTNHSTENI